jgi:hypothetical protein
MVRHERIDRLVRVFLVGLIIATTAGIDGD